MDLVPGPQRAAGRDPLDRRRGEAGASPTTTALRIAPVGHLCLTFDHRALDGAYAGAFLERLREIVEQRDWAAEL